MGPPVSTHIGPPLQTNSYSNSCKSNKSCKEHTPILCHQEDMYSKPSNVLLNNQLGFSDLNLTPEFGSPVSFESLTPPYQSPTPCLVKSEPIDSCSFPTNAQEFCLMDVSLPDQVIVKRELGVDTKLPQNNFLGVTPMNSASQSLQTSFMGHLSMSRLMMPLTPPSSEPGSDSIDSLSVRTTPPPPYGPSAPNNLGSGVLEARENQTASLYNRRNNPELEKRRTHRCIFPGKKNLINIKFID